MFNFVLFFFFLSIVQFSAFATSPVSQQRKPPSVTPLQDISESNATSALSSWRSKKVHVPDSSITLSIEDGKRLDQGATRAVLAVAAAFVDEEKDRHGEGTFCEIQPFEYDLGEGVAVRISYWVVPLTWGQLSTILHGLQRYQVTGNRYRQCTFKIDDSETPDIYTRVGSGSISNVAMTARKSSLTAVTLDSPNPISRRALTISPATITEERAVYIVPHSQLILVLYERGSVSEQSVEAILLTADRWVDRQISSLGPEAATDAIVEHNTGSRPQIKLIFWSPLEHLLTWGQLRTVIDGLWQYLVVKGNFGYTFWEIYNAGIPGSSQIGYGTIIATDFLPMNSSSGPNSTNATSKRARQTSSPTLAPPLNTVDPLPAPTRFPIPHTDIALSLRPTGAHISPQKLNALLFVAGAQLNEDVEKFGEHTPSSRSEYLCTLDQGVSLWLLKVSNSPTGYMTYGQLRIMVTGLQIYLVLGHRYEAVKFDVILTGGRREVVLGRGAVGRFAPNLRSNFTAVSDS